MTSKGLPSMRFSFHARTNRTHQRGYVLISVIVLAILYFALMELLLIDSSRALREAQRFRSRIVAATLAESAAELAAAQMVAQQSSNSVNAKEDQGTMDGAIRVVPPQFEITGDSATTGVLPVKANVRVQGRIEGTRVIVDYTFHSQ